MQIRTEIKVVKHANKKQGHQKNIHNYEKERQNFVKNKSTCILEGLRTSKAADALKENVVNGLDKVVEFTMVNVFESIS